MSERRAAGQTAALMELERRLLRRLAHLQAIHDHLNERVRLGNRPPGRRLVEQLDRERGRLGRELHTGVGQALTAIRLQLEIIENCAAVPQPIQDALARISRLADQGLEQVRSVSHRLHPPQWQSLPLTDALAQIWALSGIPERFDATLSLDPLEVEPPHAVKVVVYRSTQEALSNLVRHSAATAATMRLVLEGGFLRLSIEDNGKGFDLERMLADSSHLRSGIGLRSVREQVEALGGAFRMSSRPGATRMEISLPTDLPGEG
jgi:two-component system, NarL family, sensor kinase